MKNGARRPAKGLGRPGGGRDAAELIYDWNAEGVATAPIGQKPIRLNDETLRDGIQSPSAIDPPLALKLELLELMDELHIAAADIGLPGAGPRALADVTALAKHIAKERLGIAPNCAARTLAQDIAPIAEVQQRAGIPVAAYTFIGSSPIRQYAEAWDVEQLLRVSSEAIDFGVAQGLEVAFVTEDTTRSHPAALERLFRNAIEHGAKALVLCDTVGWATPDGVRRLVEWAQRLVASTGESIRLEWHGHNDRGLAVVNALFALEYGVDQVHGCALGIGERVGNTALDQLLVNLKLLGAVDWDLRGLVRYVELASKGLGFPVPRNYPLAGEDAFRTATGVHAAAIVKAERKGDQWLADRVYSGVPAGWFGKRQVIEIGPMSGLSNVTHWLSRHGVRAGEARARAVLKAAKGSNRVLTDAEVFAALGEAAGSGGSPSKRPVKKVARPAAHIGRLGRRV
ncbi:MAG: LeuA family protein [Deltaproteobacteria bacterium]